LADGAGGTENGELFQVDTGAPVMFMVNPSGVSRLNGVWLRLKWANA
jgi:hypothetical protein